MKSPLVSIIMPVYNAEKYVAQAVNSILEQTYSNTEFIIINDGSTDKTLSILNSFRDKKIILINDKNSGCARQRNYGLSLAKGEIVALMDADDISAPTRIERQLEYLLKHNDIRIIGANCWIIDANGNKIREKKYYETHDKIEYIAPIFFPMCHPSLMAYRSTMLEGGGYSENIIAASDHEYLLRLIKSGVKINNVQESLYYYREWTGSLSVKKINLQRNNHYLNARKYLLEQKELINADNFHLRMGLVEYYYGHISNVRPHLYKIIFHKETPKLKVIRIILLSFIGNKIIKYMRYKGVLSWINNIIQKVFQIDIQSLNLKKNISTPISLL